MDSSVSTTSAEDRPILKSTAGMSTLIVVAALLPVALLSFFSYRLAVNRMESLVRSSNQAASEMIGELVRGDLARNIDMGRALSAQPGMVRAVQERDVEAVRMRLRATVEAVNVSDDGTTRQADDNSPRRIDRAYVTDTNGVQWSDYPHAPESIGKNFSHLDWYKEVSKTWQPYLSGSYQRNAKPRIQIIAMASPVRDPAGKVIGIIVFQMPLEYLSRNLRSMRVGTDGYAYVIDKNGVIVAHPRIFDLSTKVYDQPKSIAPIRATLEGKSVTEEEYDDPISGERMLAAFQRVKVPNGSWAVVAQQPWESVRGPVRKLAWSIAIGGLVVSMVAIGLVMTLRQAALKDQQMNRDLEAKSRRLTRLKEELEKTVAMEQEAHQRAQAAHDELKQTQGRLVQSEKLAALGQLVAGVAHEINNPLAFVLNNVAVLQRDMAAMTKLIALYQSADSTLEQAQPALMKQVREFAEEIDLAYTLTELIEIPTRSREGLVRIQQIVKDLRDFARQNAIGDVQNDADLNAGVESTINIARGMAKKHQVELVADLGELPRVTCSPGKINQVILNLVTNAVHASNENSKVTVKTETGPLGVCIKVIDQGSGIPPEIREKIFDPFFTTKPQGQGTGLGLSISHGIISDHGGKIEVESVVGEGTTFSVHLPIMPEKMKENLR